MLKRLIVVTLVILFGCSALAAAENSGQTKVTEVDSGLLGTDKAAWIGKTVYFFPAKLHQGVSYLFLYARPGDNISGVDQLLFARTLVGKSFIIKGLYRLNKGNANFYWRLDRPDGSQSVWVKDNSFRPASEEPFALPDEVARDQRDIGKTAALISQHVWVNRNMIGSKEIGEDVSHLERLTVSSFRSGGPLSDQYVLMLSKDDGTAVCWTVGYKSTIPVYNHQQFIDLYQRSFYTQDPLAAHADWPEEKVAALKARKVVVGWEKELVELSWGQPLKITKANNDENKRHSGAVVWEYDGQRFLYFKKDILIAIEIPDPQAVNNKKSPNQGRGKFSLMEVQEAVVQ